MAAPKVFLNRVIPTVKHQKSEREKNIDSCIPDAADAANIRLMRYKKRHPGTTRAAQKDKISVFFLEEMIRITHKRGFRRSLATEKRILFRRFDRVLKPERIRRKAV